MKIFYTIIFSGLLLLVLGGCRKKTESQQGEAFSLPVLPKIVYLYDGKINPSDASFYKGSYITFTNQTDQTHTLLSSDADSTIYSGPIAKGSSYTVQILQPGLYTYKCIEHNISATVRIIQ